MRGKVALKTVELLMGAKLMQSNSDFMTKIYQRSDTAYPSALKKSGKIRKFMF